MTLFAGHLRKENEIVQALSGAEKLYAAIEAGGYPAQYGAQALINRQLAFAHMAYLSAILFQIRSGTGSRGSAAVLDDAGVIVAENTDFRKQVLETRFTDGEFQHRWVPCRPIPETDGWFENVWADYRTKNVYKKNQECK